MSRSSVSTCLFASTPHAARGSVLTALPPICAFFCLLPLHCCLQGARVERDDDAPRTGECFVYRYILRESCSQFDSLPLTYLRLVQSLVSHDAVARVYHPSVGENGRTAYAPWRRAGQDGEGEGYGSLFSVLLKDTENARQFYDRLDVAKGPGFGSNFTLACPYTMIAHFNELGWAEQFGVDRSLVRVWIGLEEADHLIATFGKALDGLPSPKNEY